MAFLQFSTRKKARTLDFFRIFRNPAAQKWPGARDCWHFCYFLKQKKPGPSFFFVFFKWRLKKTRKNTTKRIRRLTFCRPPGEDPDKENPRPPPLPGKKHVKTRQKESAGPPFATPREKTWTKRTLGPSLYREKTPGARDRWHFC